MAIDPKVTAINNWARIIAEKRDRTGKDAFLAAPEETSNLWIALTKRKNSAHLPTDDEEAFYKAFQETLKNYNAEKGDYMPFFESVFGKRKIDEKRKLKNNKELNVSFSQLVGDINNGEPDIEDKAVNIEEKAVLSSELESSYRLIAAICIEQKKAYSKSPKICYPPLFFTDNIVYNVFDTEYFDEVVKNNANKFDMAASIDFLNKLLTGNCSSVTEINKFKCRPLSEFMESSKDPEKPCCDGTPNYRVFNSCLKDLFGKKITQSAFSSQRDNYFKLISEKLGIDGRRKKKHI